MVETGEYLLIAFIASELMLLLVRSGDITVLAKSPTQRTKVEQKRVENGLGRSILLEMSAFVPASVVLVFLCLRPFVLHSSFVSSLSVSPYALNSLLGVMSYGFPFGLLRRIIVRMALSTLKEFAQIAIKAEDSLVSSG